MPQDLKIWRRNARSKLIDSLGGKCVECGKQKDEVKLEFAHIIPLSDEQAEYRVRIGSNSRMVLYRKEAKEGLLCLKCHSCNIKQSKEPKQGFLLLFAETSYAKLNIPF